MADKHKTATSRQSLLKRLVRGVAYVPPVVAVLGALTLSGTSIGNGVAHAGGGRVDICHVRGDGNPPIPISVAEDAVPAHLAHGDFFTERGSCEDQG